MPDGFLFLVTQLGVYRLSHMIAMEDGPFDAFANMRDRVGQATWIGRGLACVLCVSFWLAGLASLYLLLIGTLSLAYLPIVWLGLAGGCVVLHRFLYGGA